MTSPTSPTFLKLVTWNANGLPPHKIELESFLHNNCIDIALISETHLISHTNLPKFRNYSIYCANHPSGRQRGGSAVIIKSSLPHHDLGFYSTNSIQAAIVAVRYNQHDINVGSIYCPPRCTPNDAEFTNLLINLGPRWIVGGDFNAKHPAWGSRLTSPRGRAVHRALNSTNGFTVPPGGPTYWPTDFTKLPDTIDFFAVKGIPVRNLQSSCIVDLGSDHLPVELNVSNLPVPVSAPASLINKTTDWDAYRTHLDEQIDLCIKLQTPDDLEREADRIIDIIQRSCELSTQPVMSSLNHPEYPKFIMSLIRRRRRARKIWQQNRSPSNKLTLNRLCKDTSRVIQQWKNNSFQKYLSELAPLKEANYSLWKAAKNIRRPPPVNSPLRKPDNTWARSDHDKAATLAQHFVNVFQPNNINSSVILPDTPLDYGASIRLTSPRVVARLIDSLERKKSPGPDRILPIMIQELSKKGIVLLTYLFNAALRLRYVPKAWKRAKMIVIRKPDKPADLASSYRPISLLPIISKIFEKIVLARLQPIIETNRLLPSIQFGFRGKHSTIEQVHRLVHTISQSLEKKQFAPAVFLDVSNAFDRVWHQGLMYKLQKMLPSNLCSLMASYLQDRTFSIQVGIESSDWKPISAGVPQGSVLGPTLYVLYTADIPVSENTVTALFADDTAAVACSDSYESAVATLQSTVNCISSWAKDWKIALNDTKSTRVDFSLRPHSYIPVYIDGNIIPPANHARYLGLHLDCKLNWQEHIRRKRELLNRQSKKFYWLIGPRSELSLANKRLIYTTIFKPAWAYGCELWGSTAVSNRLIVERFQNKIMRMITNAPFYITNAQLRSDLELIPVEDVISQRVNTYNQRLHRHPNVEAITLLDTSNDTRRLCRRYTWDFVT